MAISNNQLKLRDLHNDSSIPTENIHAIDFETMGGFKYAIPRCSIHGDIMEMSHDHNPRWECDACRYDDTFFKREP